MTRSPLRRRLTAGLLLLCYLPACTKWGPPPQTGATPAQTVVANQGKAIRVTTTEGNRIEFTSATLVDDSVSGVLERDAPQGNPLAGATPQDTLRAGATAVIPLADISSVQVRRADPLATVGLVAGIAGVIVGISAIVVGNAMNCMFGC